MQRNEMIFDEGQIEAALMLNKHLPQLLALEDIVNLGFPSTLALRGRTLYANNIWAALRAIVEGHGSFEYAKHVGPGSFVCWDAPMEALENLVKRWEFTILIQDANAESLSRGLMNIRSLSSLIPEVSKLKNKYIAPNSTNDYKKIEAMDIPSYRNFYEKYKEVYLAEPPLSYKLTMEQLIQHLSSQQNEENSKIENILQTLGIKYDAPVEKISLLLNEESFLLSDLNKIVTSYLASDYINIYQNSSNHQYLQSKDFTFFSLNLKKIQEEEFEKAEIYLKTLLKPFANKQPQWETIYGDLNSNSWHVVGVNPRSQLSFVSRNEMIVLEGDKLVVLDQNNGLKKLAPQKTASVVVSFATFIQRENLDSIIKDKLKLFKNQDSSFKLTSS